MGRYTGREKRKRRAWRTALPLALGVLAVALALCVDAVG